MPLFLLVAIRIRRQVMNSGSQEMIDAWKSKETRASAEYQFSCMFKSCMHDFPFEDDIGQGPKMKEAFLKTGQFSDVHAVVKQLRTKKVKDEDTEKPVTKLMLKEIYKWDEC